MGLIAGFHTLSTRFSLDKQRSRHLRYRRRHLLLGDRIQRAVHWQGRVVLHCVDRGLCVERAPFGESSKSGPFVWVESNGLQTWTQVSVGILRIIFKLLQSSYSIDVGGKLGKLNSTSYVLFVRTRKMTEISLIKVVQSVILLFQQVLTLYRFKCFCFYSRLNGKNDVLF